MNINITVEFEGKGSMCTTINSPFTLNTLVKSYYELYDEDMKRIYNTMSDHAKMAFWFILLELYKKEHKED